MLNTNIGWSLNSKKSGLTQSLFTKYSVIKYFFVYVRWEFQNIFIFKFIVDAGFFPLGLLLISVYLSTNSRVGWIFSGILLCCFKDSVATELLGGCRCLIL